MRKLKKNMRGAAGAVGRALVVAALGFSKAIPLLLIVTLSVAALGAVAYGAYLVYKPLGFLVPGFLLWYDLSTRRK